MVDALLSVLSWTIVSDTAAVGHVPGGDASDKNLYPYDPMLWSRAQPPGAGAVPPLQRFGSFLSHGERGGFKNSLLRGR